MICSIVSCSDPVRARGLCNRHYLRAWNDDTLDLVAPLQTIAERFWVKVDKRGPDDCWLWTASTCREGYGRFNAVDSLPSTLAHRIAYVMLVGPIPDGLTLDHLCRVKACVNPRHLEPVTNAENVRRAQPWNRDKTHCIHGHAFTPENTYHADGKRACRACRRAVDHRRRARA